MIEPQDVFSVKPPNRVAARLTPSKRSKRLQILREPPLQHRPHCGNRASCAARVTSPLSSATSVASKCCSAVVDQRARLGGDFRQPRRAARAAVSGSTPASQCIDHRVQQEARGTVARNFSDRRQRCPKPARRRPRSAFDAAQRLLNPLASAGPPARRILLKKPLHREGRSGNASRPPPDFRCRQRSAA